MRPLVWAPKHAITSCNRMRVHWRLSDPVELEVLLSMSPDAVRLRLIRPAHPEVSPGTSLHM
jgi:hypothetical protein